MLGFNIIIFYFVVEVFDMFITESEIQVALIARTASANQTTWDSSRWLPANHMRWDERVLHSADRHIMAEKYEVRREHFATEIGNFGVRSYIILLKLFNKV